MTHVGLPGGVPWRFRDYSPPPALVALEGTGLAWIDDHGAHATDLLISEFRSAPRLVALIRALAAGIQDLEDACWQVLTESSLDTALGAQLDVLGRIVNLPRRGWADETYRALLSAQVLVLRSRGTWPDLLAILAAAGVAVELVVVDEPGIAAIRIVLGEYLGDDPLTIRARDLFLMIERAKAAGIRFVFEAPAADLDSTLTWADGDAAQVDAARGWADDVAATGGRWSDAMTTTEIL